MTDITLALIVLSSLVCIALVHGIFDTLLWFYHVRAGEGLTVLAVGAVIGGGFTFYFTH